MAYFKKRKKKKGKKKLPIGLRVKTPQSRDSKQRPSFHFYLLFHFLSYVCLSSMKAFEILTEKAMAVVPVQACQSHPPGLWDGLLELTKSAQERNSDPPLWAVQLSSSLKSAGVSMPSPELAHLLVSHICWANNVAIMWKFLEKAVSCRIAPPMLVLALLSCRFFFFSYLILNTFCV